MTGFLQNLLVIIVKYNCSLEECDSFNSLQLIAEKEKQTIHIYVYDNSVVSESIRDYQKMVIQYRHNPKNPGVSKAYNEGVAFAKLTNKKWVLLLDQDTVLPVGIMKNYEEALRNNKAIKLFAPILKLKSGKIFSPSRYRFKRGFFISSITSGIHSLFNLAPVNSGIMVEVEAFIKVGGYNEAVQLDFSDFQFIERFRKLDKNFFVLNTECIQDFSDNEVSYESQLQRFKFYCSGALHIENKSFIDWAQYNVVILARAARLSLRYKTFNFVGLYLRKFLFASKSLG